MTIPAPISASASVWPASETPAHILRPLMGSKVSAGFPSPADDYVDRDLDISSLLITNPPATFFVRITGDSMQGCWIRPNDIAVVDCSIEARAGHIVIAVLDGEMVIKQLAFGPDNQVLLVPRNKRYRTITVREDQDFMHWGVVTWTIHHQLP